MNTERKNEYIDYKMAITKFDKSFLPNLFKKCAPYEDAFEKDVCDFVETEVAEMYNGIGFTSLGVARVANAGYKGYTEWCMTNHLSQLQSNSFALFNSQKLKEFSGRVRGLVNRQQILTWCAKLGNASDKFLLLAIFEGIRGDEYADVRHMKLSDINMEEHKANVESCGTITISKELCGFAEEANKEYSYESMIGDRKMLPLEPSQYILKYRRSSINEPSEHQQSRRIYHRLQRIFDYVGAPDDMSANQLTYSGVMEYINQGAKKEGKSPREYWSQHAEEINWRFGFGRVRRSDFMEKYGNYL